MLNKLILAVLLGLAPALSAQSLEDHSYTTKPAINHIQDSYVSGESLLLDNHNDVETYPYLSQYLSVNTGENELSSPFFTTVFVDSRGRYFAANTDNVVDIYENGFWAHLRAGEELLGSPARVTSGNIIETNDGRILIGTTGGVNIFSPDIEPIESLNVDNGLAGWSVTTLMQQSNGNIWIGHAYDEDMGHGGITVLTDTAGIVTFTEGLIGGYIEDIEERSNGDIWISTGSDPDNGENGGITVYHTDGSMDTFTKSNSGLPVNEVTEMIEDRDGNMWVGLYPGPGDTLVGGIAMFDGINWTYYNNPEEIGHLDTWSLEVDLDGNVIRGNPDVTTVFDGTEWSVLDNGSDKFPLTSVSSIQALDNGDIVFSTSAGSTRGEGGIHMWSEGEWQFVSTMNDGGLFDNRLFTVDVDTEGNVWTAGFYGVTRFDGETFDYFNVSDGLADNYTWKLLAASDGVIWFGTSQNGVTKYENGAFEQVTDVVFEETIYEDSNGDIWFGSYSGNGILHYDGSTYTTYTDTDGLIGSSVTEISEGPDGNIYAATNAGLAVYDGSSWSEQAVDGETGQFVSELFLDSSGNMWIIGSDIFRWDGETFETFDIEISFVTDMTESEDGTVWFAGGGLAAVSGDMYVFWPQGQGAPAQAIYEIVEDTDGSLLLATFQGGLYRFNDAAAISINYAYDYPNDQGGWLTLEVGGFLLDTYRLEQNRERMASTYTVWRGNDQNGNWEPAVTANIIPDVKNTHTVSVQVPTTKAEGDEDGENEYFFKVTAHNADGRMLAESNEMMAFAVDNIAPEQVQNVMVNEQDGSILLSWDALEDNDLSSYKVYSWNGGDYLANSPVASSTSNSVVVSADSEDRNFVVVGEDIHNNLGMASDIVVITSNNEIDSNLPETFKINSVYPNPFNPAAQVSFDVPQTSEISITVYNVLGSKVATLAERTFSAGTHTVQFDGSGLASGMYLIRAQMDNQMLTKQVTLIK